MLTAVEIADAVDAASREFGAGVARCHFVVEDTADGGRKWCGCPLTLLALRELRPSAAAAEAFFRALHPSENAAMAEVQEILAGTPFGEIAHPQFVLGFDGTSRPVTVTTPLFTLGRAVRQELVRRGVRLVV